MMSYTQQLVLIVEREERKVMAMAKSKEEENFCLTYDSDEEDKAKKLKQVSSLAQSMKAKKTAFR